MTRASWETDYPVSEDKNGSVIGSADSFLEMCAETVVGHAVDSAVLQHTREVDMAQFCPGDRGRQRSLCLGSHVSLDASVHLFGGTGLGAEGETRLGVVCVTVSMTFLTTAERSGKFVASFLTPLLGFRDGETFLNSKLLDALLFEKNQAFFGVGGVVPLTIDTLGWTCA
jgi:hypothetical protein